MRNQEKFKGNKRKERKKEGKEEKKRVAMRQKGQERNE